MNVLAVMQRFARMVKCWHGTKSTPADAAGAKLTQLRACGALLRASATTVPLFWQKPERNFSRKFSNGWRLAIGLLLSPLAMAQTAPGTVINNTAQVEFLRAGTAATEVVNTNTVSATVVPSSSTSSINVLRFTDSASATVVSSAGPTQCLSGAGFTTLASPGFSNGSTVDATSPLAMVQTESVHAGDAVFIQVRDADQNRDVLARDTIDLTVTTDSGDQETVRLVETDNNSGVFTGYIQTSTNAVVPGDCALQVDRNTSLTTTYTDRYNATDRSSAKVLVDPYGLVFDSRSGQPVNGARVRLINATTGADAQVNGDDGTSTYPAEMTTGNAVTDSHGVVYNLPAGRFRFPLVNPGQYKLEITAPSGYSFPSGRTVIELNQLSGGPFNVNATGSFGANFTVTGPSAMLVDVPLDPSGTQLYLSKSTTVTSAAQGDFVQYIVNVENLSASTPVTNVVVTDTLPKGMKYQKGSARLAGATLADPVISSDARTLQFSIGTLNASALVKLSYVVEVTVAAKEALLVNSARASNTAGAASNLAQATIRLRNELFNDKAFIVGRIMQGSCDADATTLPGVAGVRVYLEDGRYAVTDEEGKYHFEGVPAGSHVVQLDTVSVADTLEAQLCDQRVRHAGRGYSQFVDVRGGSIWRADFVLKQKMPPQGTATFALNTRLSGDAELLHTLAMQVDVLPVSNAKAIITLPAGVEYVSGSAQLSEQSVADPQIMDDTLIFRIGDLPVGSAQGLKFRTRLKAEASGGFAVQALMLFDTPAQKNQRSAAMSNRFARGDIDYESASYRFAPHFEVLGTTLSEGDRRLLDKLANEWRGVKSVHIRAVGHTDRQLIAVQNRHIFADNYVLSKARAQAVADYLGAQLKLDASQIETDGKGPDEPIATGEDPASMARNRRVEIAIDGLRVKQSGSVSIIQSRADAAPLTTIGQLQSRQQVAIVNHRSTGKTLADVEVETLQPGIAFVQPASTDLPAIASLKVAVQHAVDQNVELRVNGSLVNALNFDGVATKNDRQVALSRWRGVNVKEGDNELIAIVRNADGSEAQTLIRKVHFAGSAVRAELVKQESVLSADGSTHPIVALRMFDASGNVARPGTLGTFSVESPYRSWWEAQMQKDQQLLSLGERTPQFVVDDDGLARIELEPSSQSGMAMLHLRFSERQSQDLRVWLEPQARDWILVGIAEGTAAYRTISDNAEAAAADDLKEGFAKDGRVAFFAKGRIKGDFLLTLAYDSERQRSRDSNSLLGTIDPHQYYTLYGDGSEQRFDSPSSSKLYLKLERRQFMAMFGDFTTGITVTELSRYSRTLTGFKSEYAGERMGYNVFAANTDQGAVQDQIQGDGTSGLYHLTQQNILANSDQLRIEVRDRFRSEVVIEKRTLTRYIDYDIDYVNGTLYFKEPIASRDGSFNPQYVVAQYEVSAGMKDAVTAGGRGYLKFGSGNSGQSEIGATLVNEGAQSGDSRIAGIDARVVLGEATSVRAEVARSSSDNPARTAEADAYFAEIKHVSKRVDASAYFRVQESGFGLGQQSLTENGSRKLGADSRVRLNEQWNLLAQALRQEQDASSTQRDLVAVEARRTGERTTVGGGLRHATESSSSISNTTSDQAFVDGSLKVWGDRVLLRAEQDLSLNGSSAVSDYPERSLVGADYRLNRDTTLFADYEHAVGTDYTSNMTRIGVRSSPWARAQMTSSLNQQFTESGFRTYSNLGLTQGWQVNDRLALDFGLDQSKTLNKSAGYTWNSNSARASGTSSASGSSLITSSTGSTLQLQTGDYLAMSVAGLYRSEHWNFTQRIERRDGDTEDRWSLVAGFYREAIKGHAFALSTQYLDSNSTTSGKTVNATLQLSWAYRPVDSHWIVLDRIDLKNQRTQTSSSDVQSSRLVHNTHVNWQIDNRAQLGLQFGARYVITTFDSDRYKGSSGLFGADYRRDLSKHVDVGVHGSALRSFQSGVSDASVGGDVGVTFMKNVWVAVGYNVQGYDDQDFNDAHYLAQGPYLKFRIKFDQDSFKDLDLGGLRSR